MSGCPYFNQHLADINSAVARNGQGKMGRTKYAKCELLLSMTAVDCDGIALID